jgi:cellulose synthase/poly-beta-1,6-N-acetylglucosamine synthase-like glycosyltransferase
MAFDHYRPRVSVETVTNRRRPSELPGISIVVLSYNQGAFMRETLQSLVDQQYSNLEVIIQDAGSTDGAVEIAREYDEPIQGGHRGLTR